MTKHINISEGETLPYMPRIYGGQTAWQERAIVADLARRNIVEPLRSRITELRAQVAALNSGINGERIKINARLDDVQAFLDDIVSDIEGLGAE